LQVHAPLHALAGCNDVGSCLLHTHLCFKRLLLLHDEAVGGKGGRSAVAACAGAWAAVLVLVLLLGQELSLNLAKVEARVKVWVLQGVGQPCSQLHRLGTLALCGLLLLLLRGVCGRNGCCCASEISGLRLLLLGQPHRCRAVRQEPPRAAGRQSRLLLLLLLLLSLLQAKLLRKAWPIEQEIRACQSHRT
jgi:hypothetical protein